MWPYGSISEILIVKTPEPVILVFRYCIFKMVPLRVAEVVIVMIKR